MRTDWLVAQMKKAPNYQREAFRRWSLLDGAEGEMTALHQSDYKPAIIALRASLDKVYRQMAKEKIDGTAPLSYLLETQA